MSAPTSERDAARAVAAFNAVNPIGTAVEYRSYPTRAPLTTKTRSAAWVLGGHTAVTMVEGVSGCVALFALTVTP